MKSPTESRARKLDARGPGSNFRPRLSAVKPHRLGGPRLNRQLDRMPSDERIKTWGLAQRGGGLSCNGDPEWADHCERRGAVGAQAIQPLGRNCTGVLRRARNKMTVYLKYLCISPPPNIFTQFFSGNSFSGLRHVRYFSLMWQ